MFNSLLKAVLSSVSLIFLTLSPASSSALPSYSSPHGEHLSPHPFSYQYQVNDDITKNIFSKTETQVDYLFSFQLLIFSAEGS
jgi:hypothetical protein